MDSSQDRGQVKTFVKRRGLNCFQRAAINHNIYRRNGAAGVRPERTFGLREHMCSMVGILHLSAPDATGPPTGLPWPTIPFWPSDSDSGRSTPLASCRSPIRRTWAKWKAFFWRIKLETNGHAHESAEWIRLWRALRPHPDANDKAAAVATRWPLLRGNNNKLKLFRLASMAAVLPAFGQWQKKGKTYK
jgi:hypothetical protein